MKENSNSTGISKAVIVAGVNRFFDEGYTIWSKENLEKIFGGEIDYFLLSQWSELGFIEILGEQEGYMRVISVIHD